MSVPLFSQLADALQYSFIQRALIAGCFISVSCAILGVFLVLRRFALIGDGIAHVSFAAVALGLLLKAQPIAIALPLVAAASLLLLYLSEKEGVYNDAAIGLVSSFSVALGVILASVCGGFNADLFSYLFGNILSVSSAEVGLTIALSLTVLGLVWCFYHDLFSITFDQEHAKVRGLNTGRINQVLVLLTSCTVVLGIRIVGTMLVSSLIVLPAVTALQLVRSFKVALLAASVLAVTSVILGVCISYVLNLPTGATIVQVNFIFFIAAVILRKCSA